MRGGRYLVVVAGVGVLAAGCGTRVAQAGNVAGAAANTAGQSARVTVTTTTSAPGMSISITQVGVFDFAHSRGVLRTQSPARIATEELFVPPRVYVKLPGIGPGPLPRGKSWIAVGATGSDGPGAALLGPFAGTDPANLLASLKAAAGSVTNLGSATIRGARVTHFRVSIDPEKAASQIPRWQRAGFREFARSLGTGSIPVEAGGHWYVDLDRSSTVAFGAACG
jgi:hypothetical protein